MSPPSQYHVFTLPRELLETLVPRDIVNRPPSPPPSEPTAPQSEQVTSTTGARACNICLGAAFADVDSQRIHFRSDWHRYNVKMRINGSLPVTEAHFASLVDRTSDSQCVCCVFTLTLGLLELDDSISGSESTSDDDSDDSDAVAALVDKTRKLGRSPSPDESKSSIPRTALTWFHAPPSTQIGVYKALFPTAHHAGSYLDELRTMQEKTTEGRTWALFMTAGGHFAGAIVRVSRPADIDGQGEVTKKGKPKKPVPDIEVLKHKTFHRYTSEFAPWSGRKSVADCAI